MTATSSILEYFGSSSGRYSADVEAPGTSAYGPFMPVSQGVPSLDGMVGPNVGPYQGASCTQTGGRKSKSKSRSRKSKSRSRKSRSSRKWKIDLKFFLILYNIQNNGR